MQQKTQRIISGAFLVVGIFLILGSSPEITGLSLRDALATTGPEPYTKFEIWGQVTGVLISLLGVVGFMGSVKRIEDAK